MRVRSNLARRSPCLVGALLLTMEARLMAAPPLIPGPNPPLPLAHVSLAGPAPIDATPLGFEPNLGQAPPDVLFVVNTGRYSVRLNEQGATLRLPGGGSVHMSFPGSRATAAVEGAAVMGRRSHYYAGEDRAGWVTDVPHYAQVRYAGLYSGIDAVFREHKGDVEYDLLVAPGADPRVIRIAFDGARRLRLDRNGDLVLTTTSGEVRQRRPYLYQDIDGRRRTVDGRFVRRGRKTVGFKVGKYDRAHTLVIDPVIVYSTFGGGARGSGAADGPSVLFGE